jgi:hypothetical protein
MDQNHDKIFIPSVLWLFRERAVMKDEAKPLEAVFLI